MEAAPPQLHDSLDLAALKQQAEAAKVLFERGRKVQQYARIFFVVSIGFGVFFPIAFTRSSPFFRAGLGVLWVVFLLASTALIAVSVMMVVSYRQYRRYIERVNTFAPSFVPRTKRAYLKFFSPVAILVYVPFILAIVLFEFNNWFIVGIVLIYLYLYLYRRFLMWTLKGGLPRIEKVLGYLPNNAVLTDIKISHLFNDDRTDEAERISHDALMRADSANLRRVALRLNNLGYGLTIAGQYEKALPILEAAIQILPGYSNSYDSLAAWYLEQNYDPERALELSEIALNFTAPGILESRAVKQATSAHALALTGRDSRAEALLSAALETSESIPPNASAEVHRQAGYVRLAQNNREAAVEHFQKAIELDPDGIYGKLAQRAIDTIAPPS